MVDKPSLDDVLRDAPWVSLEEHLNVMPGRVDASIHIAHKLREQFRDELLQSRPELLSKISRPSPEALKAAEALFRNGAVAAADGDLFIASRTMIGISSNFCHRNPVSASTISLGPPESCTIGTHEADIASTIVIPKCSPTIMCRYTFDSPRML